MADVSSHAPGSFSWAELATTDQASGVAFYRALFDWAVDESPVGPGETYAMFQLRGRPVAAAYSMRPEERQAGAPPHWNLYVTVSSADDSAKRAEALGGTIIAPPFDVMDVGRMAVLRDPSGAFFQIWEPRKHVGAMVVNEPGALCWTELASRDAKGAKAFYTSLFGWKAKDSSADAPMEYTEFSVGEQPSIWMMPMPHHVPAQVPSVLAAVLPGGGLRRDLREGEAAWRRRHRGAAGHPEHRAFRGAGGSSGGDVRDLHVRARLVPVPTDGAPPNAASAGASLAEIGVRRGAQPGVVSNS